MKLIHFQNILFYKVIFRENNINLKLLNFGYCTQSTCVNYKMWPSEWHVGDGS